MPFDRHAWHKPGVVPAPCWCRSVGYLVVSCSSGCLTRWTTIAAAPQVDWRCGSCRRAWRQLRLASAATRRISAGATGTGGIGTTAPEASVLARSTIRRFGVFRRRVELVLISLVTALGAGLSLRRTAGSLGVSYTMAGLLTSTAGISGTGGFTTGTAAGIATRSTRYRLSEYVGPVASMTMSSVYPGV